MSSGAPFPKEETPGRRPGVSGVGRPVGTKTGLTHGADVSAGELPTHWLLAPCLDTTSHNSLDPSSRDPLSGRDRVDEDAARDGTSLALDRGDATPLEDELGDHRAALEYWGPKLAHVSKVYLFLADQADAAALELEDRAQSDLIEGTPDYALACQAARAKRAEAKRRRRQAHFVRHCCGGAVVLRARECPCACELVAPGRCNRIGCPRCMKQRAGERVTLLAPEFLAFRRLRFFTLSMRNVPRGRGALRGAMRELVAGFNKLRSRVWWKRSMPNAGGVYNLETTIGKRYTWNQHLHALVGTDEGPPVDFDELIAQWGDACGLDYAPHVYVTEAHDHGVRWSEILATPHSDDRLEAARSCVREACKYITKGVPGLPISAAAELILAKEGQRWFSKFGTLYHRKLSYDDTGARCKHGHSLEWADWVDAPDYTELHRAGANVVALLKPPRKTWPPN